MVRAAPAPPRCPWAQGRASGAPRRGWRRNPAPSRARAAAREPIPAWSTTRGLRGGGGGVLHEDGLGRGNADGDAAPSRAGRARGLCGELGERGASAPRAPPSRSARRPPARARVAVPEDARGPGRCGERCTLALCSLQLRHPGHLCPDGSFASSGAVGRGLGTVLGELQGERREERNQTRRCPPSPSRRDVCGGVVGPYTFQNRSPPPRSGFFGEIRRALAYSLLFLGEGLLRSPPY